jgi:hypothetical protein
MRRLAITPSRTNAVVEKSCWVAWPQYAGLGLSCRGKLTVGGQ